MRALRILGFRSIFQPIRLVAYYWTARASGYEQGKAEGLHEGFGAGQADGYQQGYLAGFQSRQTGVARG
jgi:hypothetical protein